MVKINELKQGMIFKSGTTEYTVAIIDYSNTECYLEYYRSLDKTISRFPYNKNNLIARINDGTFF